MECRYDSDCNLLHKCCSNGCGKTCVAPEKLTKRQDWGRITRDSDQGWDEEETGFPGDKEGSNVSPYARPNPGTCPKSDGMIGACVMECRYDSDCNLLHKCCSNGCGKNCVAPEKLTKRQDWGRITRDSHQGWDEEETGFPGDKEASNASPYGDPRIRLVRQD